jgi:hypothetical protein
LLNVTKYNTGCANFDLKSLPKSWNRFPSARETNKSAFVQYLIVHSPLTLSISRFSRFASEMTIWLLLTSFLDLLFSSGLLFLTFHGSCLLTSEQKTYSPLFTYWMCIVLNSGGKSLHSWSLISVWIIFCFVFDSIWAVENRGKADRQIGSEDRMDEPRGTTVLLNARPARVNCSVGFHPRNF